LPFCAHDNTQVKDSRPAEDNTAIRRRRQCENCGGRFSTFERVQLREVFVIKSGGASDAPTRREPFDRSKIDKSVSLACRKRGIAQERLDQLVSGIQRQIETMGESEDRQPRHRRDGDGGPAPARQRGLYPLRLGLSRLSPRRAISRNLPAMSAISGAGLMTDAPHKPVIVLVRPQLGENIGKAARAMLNFGLTDCGWFPRVTAGPTPAPVLPPRAPMWCWKRRRSSRRWPRPWAIAPMSMPPPCASAASPSRC
jgi:hypothetical protein